MIHKYQFSIRISNRNRWEHYNCLGLGVYFKCFVGVPRENPRLMDGKILKRKKNTCYKCMIIVNELIYKPFLSRNFF